MKTRFVFGRHTVRNGEAVVEVYDGDNFIASIYAGEHTIKVVSRYFAQPQPINYDTTFPQAITLTFAGSAPPGRERHE